MKNSYEMGDRHGWNHHSKRPVLPLSGGAAIWPSEREHHGVLPFLPGLRQLMRMYGRVSFRDGWASLRSMEQNADVPNCRPIRTGLGISRSEYCLWIISVMDHQGDTQFSMMLPPGTTIRRAQRLWAAHSNEHTDFNNSYMTLMQDGKLQLLKGSLPQLLAVCQKGVVLVLEAIEDQGV